MKLWIARDKQGRLNLFDGKPIKSGDCFIEETGLDNIMSLPISIFPEIIFENSPQQVELKLIKD